MNHNHPDSYDSDRLNGPQDCIAEESPSPDYS